jgi:hypothetical protein
MYTVPSLFTAWRLGLVCSQGILRTYAFNTGGHYGKVDICDRMSDDDIGNWDGDTGIRLGFYIHLARLNVCEHDASRNKHNKQASVGR